MAIGIRSAKLELPLDGTRRTAHELVRDVLRTAILRGALPVGTRLVQAEIAGVLDVSTTPVREALRDLATEGLIRLDPHRGAIVNTLSREDLREIYDIRCVLEPEAYRRTARNITAEELDEAEVLATRMEATRDPSAWLDLSHQFHRLLLAASRSPRLIEILDRLRDSASPYVALSLALPHADLAAADDDHRRILAALREGDVDRVVGVALEHLETNIMLLENPGMPVVWPAT